MTTICRFNWLKVALGVGWRLGLEPGAQAVLAQLLRRLQELLVLEPEF